MKAKFYLIAAAACAALAACSKNEVAPVDVDQEITYQTLSTKGTVTGFNTGKAFISYAYFTNEEWASAGTKADYIKGQKIWYHDNYVSGKDAWVGSNKYYWPKSGYLTFFAWSDYTNNPSQTTASCSSDKGVCFTDYETTNSNTDLLVAKIAENKQANPLNNSGASNSSAWVPGVPTIFQHILSNIVLTANTKENYTDAEIYITSVKINQLFTKGNYEQGVVATNSPIDVTWNSPSVSKEIPLYTPASSTLVTYTASTPEALSITSGTDYSIVLPQNVNSGNKLIVEYIVKTNYGSEFSKSYTLEKELGSLLTDSKFKPGYQYTINMVFGLDEIYWDPAETEWVVETQTVNI